MQTPRTKALLTGALSVALIAVLAAGSAAGQSARPKGKGAVVSKDAALKPPPPPKIVTRPAEIEPGVYACVKSSKDGKTTSPTGFSVNIQDKANYLLYVREGEEKNPGNYTLDSKSGTIAWTSGPLKGRPAGKYEGDRHIEPNQMRISVAPEADQLSCYMRDGPA